MKLTNAPALIAANRVYRSRSYRDGLLTGAFAGAAIMATLGAAALGIWIRNP